MRYINIIDDTIQFIDVDNTVTNVPVNGVYTFIKGDTISFILLRRLDNEGYCVMTTRASDVEINGTVYSIDDYIDGTATQDLYTATGLRFEVVEELPDEGQSGVIYLVPNEDDTYDEYIWLEDEERFERVGNTDVDRTNYYTKSEVDTMVDSINDTIEANERIIASALVDLNENKADKSEIPVLTDYATKTYVDEAIAEIPQPDMSNYYDKDEIDEGNRVVSTALNRLNSALGDIDTALSQIIGSNS